MAQKVTVCIANNPRLERVMLEREQDIESGANCAALVTAMVDRYAEMIRRAIPVLSVEEWGLIADALRGKWTIDCPAWTAQMLPELVQDGITEGLTGQWKVEGRHLIPRLEALDMTGRLAVIDVVERHWSRSNQGEDLRASLSRHVLAFAGEKIAEERA